jgi:hypothetical protein
MTVANYGDVSETYKFFMNIVHWLKIYKHRDVENSQIMSKNFHVKLIYTSKNYVLSVCFTIYSSF